MELKQVQTQSLSLSQQQMLGLSLLQMNRIELEAYLREAALENPVIDLCEADPAEASFEEFIRQQEWLKEQAAFGESEFSRGEDDPADPFSAVPGSISPDETLAEALKLQIHQLKLPLPLLSAVEFLAESLDENGFLGDTPEELSRTLQLPAEDAAEAVAVLQSLDPPGVGAADVKECLLLQLRRSGAPETAERIVLDHLEDLARRNYRAIARELAVPPAEVKEAAQLIRQADPYPGRRFASAFRTEYIYPEISVRKENGVLSVAFARGDTPYFTVNPTYLELYRSTDDPSVRKYLSEKLSQAKTLQWAAEQRKSTLQRCVGFITEFQRDFFTEGVQALRPLKLADAAETLNVHVSTVSRAIRGKYLQCGYGVFPLSFFFSGSAGTDPASASAVSVREKLKELIREEPGLSDQKLADRLKEAGFPISRRTVAKYRSQLRLPNAYYRHEKAAD